MGIISCLVLSSALPLYSHILDELAINSLIGFEKDYITLKVTVFSGMLFGSDYLNMLDPDKNRTFEEENVRIFSRYIQEGLKVRLNEEKKTPLLNNWSLSSFEEFMSGFCTIQLLYTLPYPETRGIQHTLYFENCLEPDIAIYTLSVLNNNKTNLKIIQEDRNEILQDLVTVTFGFSPSPHPAPIQDVPEKSRQPLPSSRKTQELQERQRDFSGTAGIIERIKTGKYNPLVLLFLALGIGFLHAFTPGHGKSLVGAYLVANRGTLIQAVGLGLVVTLTHTLSIYILGGLASAAAYIFIPSKIIPIMSVITGVLIILIALWTGLIKAMGLETDHAHILPNLKVLQEKQINIILDGSSGDSSEFLIIESEGTPFKKQLKAAGAEGINICSPGCETHRFIPPPLAERQSLQLMKMALETGAVEAVISSRAGTLKHLKKIRTAGPVSYALSLDSFEEASDFLDRALGNFGKREIFQIPDDRLPWKRLIPLGIAGGAAPCPDALAILLIAISLGRPVLGLEIVLAFSTGLAVALVIIGGAVVLSQKLISRNNWFKGLSRIIPGLSTIFLIGLGLFLIINNLNFRN